MGAISSKKNKKHVLAWKHETRRMTCISSKSVHEATLAHDKETKKERKRNLTVVNCVFAQATTSSDRSQILHVSIVFGGCSKCQVSSNWVTWFGGFGGRNLSLSRVAL